MLLSFRQAPRADFRCGARNENAKCDPESDYPCCSQRGWHAGIFRIAELVDPTGRAWENPLRCWAAQLDSSEHRFRRCGNSDTHCSCIGCVDYRRPVEERLRDSEALWQLAVQKQNGVDRGSRSLPRGIFGQCHKQFWPA